MNLVIVSLLGLVLGSLMTSCRPLPTLDAVPSPSVGALAPTRKDALPSHGYAIENYCPFPVWNDDEWLDVEDILTNSDRIEANGGKTYATQEENMEFYMSAYHPFTPSLSGNDSYPSGWLNYWPSYSNLEVVASPNPSYVFALPCAYGLGVKNSFGYSTQVRVYPSTQDGGGNLVAVGAKGWLSSSAPTSYVVETYPKAPFRLSRLADGLGAPDESSKETFSASALSVTLTASDLANGAFFEVEPAVMFSTSVANHSTAPVTLTWRGNTQTLAVGETYVVEYPWNTPLEISSSNHFSAGSFLGGKNLVSDEGWVRFNLGDFAFVYLSDPVGSNAVDLGQVFALIGQAFGAWTPIFGIQVFGGLTLGTLILVPLACTLLIVIVRLLKK